MSSVARAAAAATAAAPSKASEKAPMKKSFSVYRYDPEEKGSKPRMQTYEVRGGENRVDGWAM